MIERIPVATRPMQTPAFRDEASMTVYWLRYRDIILAWRGEHVAQFVVRNLEDDVVEKLKRRAKRNQRSMEDEVRHILRAAVREGPAPERKLGSRIALRFRRAGLTGDIPEWRGRAARAADFDE